ncbi:hypothetical protein [Rhizobium sp. CNPSo 4039]|uniref:hypothetical protein n=1 Tax=Rhizobium sp. CNPSo 4039 TaxID=3021409 RepID=UPI00254B6F17|nr:hypothetical protein [Rhizobium sp. CNPSo 4039]MDK4717540.1 hypothetical protein [Rhizobium sp. CNPSo 4039]
MDSEALRHPSNGIWLCGHHADLIDKKSGLRYPPTVIKSWKALHEFRTAYEHSERTSTFGFIRKLEVHNSPLFEPGTSIELGKTTFLIGGNSSGKTALCDWITAIEDPRRLKRWLEPNALAYTLTFDLLSEHQLSIDIKDNVMTTRLDQLEVVSNHHRIGVVFLEDKREREYLDDLALFCDSLNLDPITTRTLARYVGGVALLEGSEFIVEESEDGEVVESLYCRLAGRGRLPYGALSSGEKSRVLLEFAISYAQSVAKVAPALLIIEWEGLSIDKAGFEFYTEFLSGPSSPFQSIIIRHETTALIEGLGWQTYFLDCGSDKYRKVTPILRAEVSRS